MTYEQQEKINELKNFLTSITTNRANTSVDELVQEEDLKWNASLFLAKAIHLAQPLGYECAIESFNLFKSQFETENGIQFNAQILFNRFWLRNILGYVELSGTVSTAIYTYDQISPYRIELQFLLEFTESIPKDQRKITSTDLESAIASYETTNNVVLNKNGVYLDKWLSKDIDNIHVTISSINIYFKPFLNYWNDFKFLSAFQKKKKEGIKGLIIAKNDLEQLHKSFGNFYTKTPSIDGLISQNLITRNEDQYCLNFWNSEIKYWSNLADRITGYYWEILLVDERIYTDEDRIKRFLEQTSYWENRPDLLEHTTREAKKRFLDAAFKLVSDEQDYWGVQQEFKRVNIDRRFGSETQVLFDDRDEYEDFTLDNSNYFELLESLDLWEKKASTTYLHEQSSREKIGYLIKLIVYHDDQFETVQADDTTNIETHYFRRIFGLLNSSLDRPSILWKVTRYILLNRREVLSYFLADKKFASLAFQLINTIEFPISDKVDYSKKLWMKCIDLVLHTVRLNSQEEGTASLLIFQIFRALNAAKYNISYGRQSSKAESENKKVRVDKEQSVLSAIENSPLNNNKVHGGYDEYLLPNIAEELALSFVNFKEREIYSNGTVQFPMMQWDGLTWLMKCSTYWKYKNQFTTKDKFVHGLANSFFKIYMSIIEVTEINHYNYFERKQERGLPLWSEKIERLDLIDWVFPIYFIHHHQLLNSFLAPRFFFDLTTDHYHKANHFTADKLRSHLGVLIQVLRKLVLPSVPYGLQKNILLKIKSGIEDQIVEYLRKHVRDVPQEGRIDLFDFHKEWGLHSSENEALLPQIARAINWFEDKTEIVDALIQSQDVSKLLTIAEWITSEGIRKKLFEKIQQSDIPAFLESIHWAPIARQVLVQIRQYPDLIIQINQVVEFWKKEVSAKKDEYAIRLYETELLLAYFRGDENEIKNSSEPQINGRGTNQKELSFADLKTFYIGLLRMNDSSKDSYAIFERLTNRYPHFPVLAINRMAAKINMGRENNNQDLYREALEEWNNYTGKADLENESSLSSTFHTNKIYVLQKLKEYDDLDEMFRKLELPFQMLPDIFSLKIESLIERKRIEEALSLLDDAENYHQFSGSTEISFIIDLKNNVNGIDNVSELRTYYSRIFDCKPSKLIKIFPDRLNGRTDLREFIAKEVALAASKMLDKINSLPDILKLKNTSKENRFNDLLELALESRIGPWGWSVKPQNRKGFSPAAKDLGAIDLDIKDSNQETIVNCESFILRDAKRVQSHLEKLISSYGHQRDFFLLITFYTGTHKNFDKEWVTYSLTTLTSIKYPVGYELDSNSIVDVTKEFGYENTGIRIGKGTLKSGSLLLNIFVNIDYVVR